jgi:Arc/MetJ-type ribon-helix-helix transcriptional regulator
MGNLDFVAVDQVCAMSSGISPENERFIDRAVRTGRFPDRGSALDAAVDLLKRRLELVEHIDEGTRQLRSGQYTEYDERGLDEFFDAVQRLGRQRYEAHKKSP